MQSIFGNKNAERINIQCDLEWSKTENPELIMKPIEPLRFGGLIFLFYSAEMRSPVQMG